MWSSKNISSTKIKVLKEYKNFKTLFKKKYLVTFHPWKEQSTKLLEVFGVSLHLQENDVCTLYVSEKFAVFTNLTNVLCTVWVNMHCTVFVPQCLTPTTLMAPSPLGGLDASAKYYCISSP